MLSAPGLHGRNIKLLVGTPVCANEVHKNHATSASCTMPTLPHPLQHIDQGRHAVDASSPLLTAAYSSGELPRLGGRGRLRLACSIAMLDSTCMAVECCKLSIADGFIGKCGCELLLDGAVAMKSATSALNCLAYSYAHSSAPPTFSH